MGKETAIAWTDHTFNPVWGCTKIGPGCDFCYAEVWASRFGENMWGPDAVYREFSDKHWRQPENWNAAALKAGARRKVFCASMADIFDKRWPAHIRPRLWKLIKATPMLDWQLVTKRIGNAPDMLPADWGDGYDNVWIVPTIVNQDEADRDLPKLRHLKAKVKGVSYEPALGYVNWRPHLDFLDWIIGGGESDQRGSRECDITWLMSTILQGREAGTAVFIKQLGSKAVDSFGKPYPLPPRSKGAEPDEWPEELRVREFPASAAA